MRKERRWRRRRGAVETTAAARGGGDDGGGADGTFLHRFCGVSQLFRYCFDSKVVPFWR